MAPGPRLQELTAKYMQNPRRYFVPLANEYRKSNELDRAIALCREHLPAQPGHMSGHIVLGRAYFEKGDIEAAREVFMTSVSLDDENLIALRHLGDIARSRNEVTEARQWYARVLEADPQNEEIERIVRGLGQPDIGAAPPVPPPASPSEPMPPMAFDGPVVPNRRTPGDSALFDPTPPGLRAITEPGVRDAAPSTAAALPPVPSRTLDTFDLSTLDAPSTLDVTPVGNIEVDDGVGFMFDDAPALEDPSVSGFGTGLSLPSVDEADFSAGVQTPSQAPDAVLPVDSDPLLARPALGALASFASWRSAQVRDTPTQPPTQPPAPPATPQAGLAMPSPADDAGLFWDSGTADAAPTAPEFVTETMAALYAQQGFLQQALDVYRELAERSPWDTALQEKIGVLEAALSEAGPDKALQDDADKALQFDDLDDDVSPDSGGQSMLEKMYDVSPPVSTDSELDQTYSRPWTPSRDGNAAAEDDWFAEDDAAGTPTDGAFGGDAIFGVSTDAFGQAAIPSPGREPVSAGAAAGGSVTALAAVFGAATASAADDTAAEMLIALAGQMVGRLPKGAPTLPVPDILELPSSVPADERTGASPAPLLSFDRFFSGSGSPPRHRIDTPATRTNTPAWPPAAPPSAPPSLSPTFGGVPVIPPPPAAVTPSSWATFDQFVPPAIPPMPTPTAASASVPTAVPTPVPTPVPLPPVSAAPPGLVSPRPLVPPRPVPPASKAGAPAPYPSFSGLPLDEVAPPSVSGAADQDASPAADTKPANDSELPSEFHRWLEGLS